MQASSELPAAALQVRVSETGGASANERVEDA